MVWVFMHEESTSLRNSIIKTVKSKIPGTHMYMSRVPDQEDSVGRKKSVFFYALNLADAKFIIHIITKIRKERSNVQV